MERATEANAAVELELDTLATREAELIKQAATVKREAARTRSLAAKAAAQAEEDHAVAAQLKRDAPLWRGQLETVQREAAEAAAASAARIAQHEATLAALLAKLG